MFDAGDSVEKAKNAAQRMVAQEPDLVGATGAWLSSFTLGVTEVTERAELPVLTLSYSDQITARGFKYVFQTSLDRRRSRPNSAMPALVKLAESATGKKPTTVAIIMDNTAASVAFAKPMREGGLAKLGLKLVVDETFTPPLVGLHAADPEGALVAAGDPAAAADRDLRTTSCCVEKLNEFGLGRGRVPVISNGAHIAAPDMLKNLGKEMRRRRDDGGRQLARQGPGADRRRSSWRRPASRGSRRIRSRTYGDMWIFKEALEKAARGRPQEGRRRDPHHGHEGRPGEIFPGGRVKFDDMGRRVDADLAIVQWQNGAAGHGLSRQPPRWRSRSGRSSSGSRVGYRVPAERALARESRDPEPHGKAELCRATNVALRDFSLGPGSRSARARALAALARDTAAVIPPRGRVPTASTAGTPGSSRSSESAPCPA